MTEYTAFSRIGQAQVIAKVEDLFTVQITLNGSPDSMWTDCYTHPSNYVDNESHPSRTVVKGNKIVFFSIETELEKNIGWIDNYLKQANECYRKRILQESTLRNEESGHRKIKQQELDRVNENIKEI